MKSLFLILSVLGMCQMAVSAADVSDLNVFNPTGLAANRATVNSSSNYPGFVPSNADDGNGSQFVFGDYLRAGSSNITVDVQLLSFSNFTNLTGISSLRFYDANEFEVGRVADTVTIYTSTVNQTSLTLGDYTELGTFALPSTLSNNGYTGGTGANGTNFDTLTGLGIGADVKSILLDFGPEREHNGGTTYTGPQSSSEYNVGAGFQEIQAFAAVPEPSTYAMMILSVAFLGFCLRRKTARL